MGRGDAKFCLSTSHSGRSQGFPEGKIMVKDVFHSIAAAAQRLFVNWAALLISLSMYSALLGAIYLFFTIREATATQVTLGG